MAGTCGILSSLAAVAEEPNLIRDIFLNEDNNAGIYGVKFFIRGKPWVVDVDDTLLFNEAYHDIANGLPAGPVNAKPFDNNGDLWGTILEKAWGKVKGDMTMAGQGDFLETAQRSLIGSPSFNYYPAVDEIDMYYQMIGTSDAAGYFMGAGTGNIVNGEVYN